MDPDFALPVLEEHGVEDENMEVRWALFTSWALGVSDGRVDSNRCRNETAPIRALEGASGLACRSVERIGRRRMWMPRFRRARKSCSTQAGTESSGGSSWAAVAKKVLRWCPSRTGFHRRFVHVSAAASSP